MKSLAKYISYLALGALAASCADDGLADKGKTTLEADTPYYINLRLVTENDNFTRAGDEGGERPGTLIDGDHNEHYISPKAHNFALFFDKDNKYITYADLYSVNEPGVSDGKKLNDPDYDHGAEKPDENGVPVEATYSCRFYGFANRKPKKVLVVANANNKIYNQLTNFPGWDIEDVMKQVWEEKGRLEITSSNGKTSYKYEEDPYDELGFCKIEEENGETEEENGETNKYFTMTNSSYIDSEGNLHCATEIPDLNITTDPEEAKTLAPVLVYLERMVSKFNMELSFNSGSYQPTEIRALDVCVYHDEHGGAFTYYDCPWALDILGWGLNGLETKNYIFKNLDTEGDWLIHPGWNSIAERRSFWTFDPHYSQDDVYPWQFDEAKNIYDLDHPNWYTKFLSYDDQGRKDDFALIYYPLTHFCEDIDAETGKLKDEENFTYKGATATYYTPENSFLPGMQVDLTRGTRAYELAGTHILIAARLRVANNIVPDENGKTGTGAIEPFDGNIYRNRVGVTYLDEVSMFEDFMNAINYKMESQKYIYYRYYPWNEDPNVIKKKSAYFGKTLRAEHKGAYALYYYDDIDKVYYEITSSRLRALRAKPEYKLYREADAVNADGKVIPWIMLNGKPQRLFMLYKNSESNYKPGLAQDNYNPDEGEILDPSKFKEYDCTDLVEVKNEYGIVDKDENDKPVTELIPVHVDFNTYLENRRVTISFLQSTAGIPDVDDKYGVWVELEYDKVNKPEKDDNDIQSIFFEIAGAVDCYNHGLMYYAIPIHAQESNGTPAVGTNKPPYEGSPAGFDDISLAYYYGVIRNNWYKFTLHSISDLGIPVENPAKPIVPNYNNKKSQVKVEAEIIPMHIEDIIINAK